jgi:hypothetical protein
MTWSIVADSLSLRGRVETGAGGQSAEPCRAWLLPGDAVASGRGGRLTTWHSVTPGTNDLTPGAAK